MKRFLIILAILIVVILGAVLALPILFKDTVRAVLDKEISRNVHAHVFYDPDKIGLSVIKQFPNLTLTLEDFGIVGFEPFEGDTLAAVEAFDLTIDLMSLITGDQVVVRSVNLINPRVMVLINEEGQANYDIMITGEEDVQDDVGEVHAEDEMLVSIDNWSVRNGRFVYYDFESKLLMALDGVNHTGSGDFSSEIFDVTTSTKIERMMASYNDVEYLKDKTLDADMVVRVDLNNSTYTFGENQVQINDFRFGFQGFVELSNDQYSMDIGYQGNDNSVKSILSLIPGAYTEDFKDVKASGILDFQGYVKGIYNESKQEYPAFSIQLSGEDGRIQYPDLPKAIERIGFDLQAENTSGNFEETLVELRKLHLELGGNPVDVVAKIKNLSDYDMNALIKAHVDLADILEIYPLEATTISGIIDADLVIDGVYDTVRNTIPISGNLKISDMDYQSPEFKQRLQISSSDLDLSEKRIAVNNFKGQIGKSDLALKGYLENYIDYILHEEALLTGKFDFQSEFLDVNEWMPEDEDTNNDTESGEQSQEKNDTQVADSEEPFRIPTNIDFILDSKIKKVLYDNLELDDFAGQMIVRNGAIQFKQLGFNSLGGQFSMDGTFDTNTGGNSVYDFDLGIKELSIPESFKYFMTIQTFAPIASIMEGLFSSKISIKGGLHDDLSPDLTTLSAKGFLNIAKAAIRGSESKVITEINQVSKLSGQSTDIRLADVILNTEIENGRVFVQPFNIRLGENNALIAGSNGIDGSMDYSLKIDVPKNMTSTAGTFLTSIAGKEVDLNSKDLKLNLKVGGFYNDPKISVLGVESGESGQAAEEVLKASLEKEKEKALVEAEKLLDEKTEEAPEEVQKILDDHEEEIEIAKDKLKKFFKKDKGN